jgi:hypothetical protein
MPAVKAPPMFNRNVAIDADSFDRAVEEAVNERGYKEAWAKILERERLNNRLKVNMMAYLSSIKALKGVVKEEGWKKEDSELLVEYGHRMVDETRALWTLKAEKLGLCLEEYVNRFVNF